MEKRGPADTGVAGDESVPAATRGLAAAEGALLLTERDVSLNSGSLARFCWSGLSRRMGLLLCSLPVSMPWNSSSARMLAARVRKEKR